LLQQTADGRFVRPVILNARHSFFFSFGGAALRQDVDASRKKNPVSIAFGIERNSAMDRGDLANLSAFVIVADQRSFRAAASQLGVTPARIPVLREATPVTALPALIRRSLFARELTEIDPLLPFKIGPVNGGKREKAGLG
jgi:hypothetical protein